MTGQSSGSPDPSTPGGLLVWLVRLRWIAAGGQVLGILAGYRLLPGELPLVPLLLLVAFEASTNLALGVRLRRDQPTHEYLPGMVLGLDTLLLTGLLYLSGGPSNPFTVMYLVHVTLAAAVMRGVWAWGLGVLSVLGFVSLFWFHVPVPSLMPMSHDAGVFSLHLVGMLAAFAITATLVAAFVGRVSRSLRQREREVSTLRDRASRQERLAALATLAAGVAHELATPLNTIAVAAGELQRSAVAHDQPWEALLRDAALIRQEVRRCRGILDQLAVPSGSLSGEDPQRLDWSRLRAALPAEAMHRIELDLPSDPGGPVPMLGLARTLRALVANALEAAPDPSPIQVKAWREGGMWALQVIDHGRGMAPDILAHAGEPFFTTKGSGEGMGLGLFLAKAFAEQMGGDLALASTPGQGTRVAITWPEARHA